MSGEHFSLVWNTFPRNLSSGLYSLLTDEQLVDVTLAAEGQILRAHKLILSVCSTYFRDLFKVRPINNSRPSSVARRPSPVTRHPSPRTAHRPPPSTSTTATSTATTSTSTSTSTSPFDDDPPRRLSTLAFPAMSSHRPPATESPPTPIPPRTTSDHLEPPRTTSDHLGPPRTTSPLPLTPGPDAPARLY
jgi:hypothetical protein